MYVYLCLRACTLMIVVLPALCAFAQTQQLMTCCSTTVASHGWAMGGGFFAKFSTCRCAKAACTANVKQDKDNDLSGLLDG